MGHTGGTPEGKRKALAEFAAQFTRNPLAELGAQIARDQQAQQQVFAELAAQMARPLIDPADFLRPLVIDDALRVPIADVPRGAPPVFREIVPLAEQLDGAVERIADLLKAGGTPGHTGEKRGPKGRWNWELFLVELCGIVHEEGLPTSQEELVRRMQQWSVNNFDDHPSRSQIQTRVRQVWRRIKYGSL